MRKLLWWLFPAAVVAVCLSPAKDAIALNTAPMATCKEGVCTISEVDWNRLRDFHRRVLIVGSRIDEVNDANVNEINQLTGQLARCRSQLERRPI